MKERRKPAIAQMKLCQKYRTYSNSYVFVNNAYGSLMPKTHSKKDTGKTSSVDAQLTLRIQ